MTLEITTRPLTAAERARIAAASPRFGFATVAIWAGMVPIIVAGIIGFTLVLGAVSTGWTLVISYSLGLLFGLFGLRKHWEDFRQARRRYWDRRDQALAMGHVQRVDFTPCKVWSVTGPAGESAGYIFDAGTDHCVYWFDPPVADHPDDQFPAGEITIEIVPGLNYVEHHRIGRGTTPKSDRSIVLAKLPIDPWDEACLVSRGAVESALVEANADLHAATD